MTVLTFPMKHKFHDREDGLAHCMVCGGAEVELTTQCCGRSIEDHERVSVTEDQLDFRSGKWTQPGPVAYRRMRRTYG